MTEITIEIEPPAPKILSIEIDQDQGSVGSGFLSAISSRAITLRADFNIGLKGEKGDKGDSVAGTVPNAANNNDYFSALDGELNNG
jgi:hypothetical protein